MNKENCALKLVDEIILYYDARSKKHQISYNSLYSEPKFKMATSRVQNCSAAAVPDCLVLFCNAELWIYKNKTKKFCEITIFIRRDGSMLGNTGFANVSPT